MPSFEGLKDFRLLIPFLLDVWFLGQIDYRTIEHPWIINEIQQILMTLFMDISTQGKKYTKLKNNILVIFYFNQRPFSAYLSHILHITHCCILGSYLLVLSVYLTEVRSVWSLLWCGSVVVYLFIVQVVPIDQ